MGNKNGKESGQEKREGTLPKESAFGRGQMRPGITSWPTRGEHFSEECGAREKVHKQPTAP